MTRATTTRRSLLTTLLIAAFAIVWLGACEATPLDQLLTGKACTPSGECAKGYVCDPSTNKCVTHLDGAGGATTAATVTASSSSGGTCVSVVDCPAPADHCVAPICVGGLCGTTAVIMGAPSGLDVPNDCKTSVCDGAGHAVTVNDRTDLPLPTVCKSNVCDNGTPLFRPDPVGTACTDNNGSFCSADSLCVACLGESDCTGLPPDDECQQRVCTPQGTCAQNFTPNHTAVSAQDPGDCKVRVCNGAGAIVSEPLVTDPPNDGNDCTTQSCNADGTIHVVNIGSGISCMAGVCDGSGHCTGCVTAANCGTDTFCSAWSCMTGGICQQVQTMDGTPLPAAQQLTGDCQVKQCNGAGGIKTVASNGDVPPDDGNQCTTESCSAGSPQHPAAPFDHTCNQGGIVCDGSGSCVECNSPNECVNQGGICSHATCATHACGLADTPNNTPAPVNSQTLGDCQLLVCNGNGGAVNQEDDNDLPVDGDDCTFDTCTAGAPSNPNAPSGTACGIDGFCDGSGTCSAKKSLGDPCSIAGECDSGNCPATDHVCCNAPCAGTCEACTSVRTGGMNGMCTSIPAGQDPDSECMQLGQSCNGSGACAFLCGQSPTSPGGTCPPECTGGCGGGVCIYDCNGPAACASANIACPAGWACQVVCDDLGACDNVTVLCPAAYACSIVCSNGACTGTALTADTGVTSFQCAGAGSCAASSVSCGPNTCTASCSGGSGQPGVTCGSSCDCTSCP